ncbi:2-phospho-L-lactate guanylyltransferase [Nocardioides sp. zg-536]|uniref:2-phospho-L-lactate guanylyltransferase n=1 Tax=Nocardioides faecalis TaxID=2803858 RepID=A0A938Y9S3_9ACTN|nr:2-phospho-L-lactate guanylyltransferase [Nocardioides faecalis]MBM9460455.1 2-phospho-L-lactate guanylyltransferase [Nocardioides faecalis]MBS4751380.1 2-phospho-L-lactate guanylyltransferase [Nocardioides faecalis]QVI60487.1 2-phospho-L-lactate guanylyltransferase [Nocardioides faecalis]
MRRNGFVVLVPAKSPGTAKSRLSALRPQERRLLAAAFATDVVDACLASAYVVEVRVVSDDPVFAATLVARGAVGCADPGGGLNAALRHAAHLAHHDHPGLQPVALCADLPALRPADLDAALSQAAGTGEAWFVRDADGTGTTLYTAPFDAFDPRFGAGSAERHEAAGCRQPQGALPTLRRDVDDVAGLRAALALGVGPATARVATSLPPSP